MPTYNKWTSFNYRIFYSLERNPKKHYYWDHWCQRISENNSTAVPSKTNDAHGRANKPHDNITVREKAVLQKTESYMSESQANLQPYKEINDSLTQWSTVNWGPASLRIHDFLSSTYFSEKNARGVSREILLG